MNNLSSNMNKNKQEKKPKRLRPPVALPVPRIEFLRKGEKKWELSQLLDGRLEQEKWIRKTIRHELSIQYLAHKKRIKSLFAKEKKDFKQWVIEQKRVDINGR